MAPEVVRHERYSMKCDVYSFAMVAFEIFEGIIVMARPTEGGYPISCPALFRPVRVEVIQAFYAARMNSRAGSVFARVLNRPFCLCLHLPACPLCLQPNAAAYAGAAAGEQNKRPDCELLRTYNLKRTLEMEGLIKKCWRAPSLSLHIFILLFVFLMPPRCPETVWAVHVSLEECPGERSLVAAASAARGW